MVKVIYRQPQKYFWSSSAAGAHVWEPPQHVLSLADYYYFFFPLLESLKPAEMWPIVLGQYVHFC